MLILLEITEERDENRNADINQDTVQDGNGNHFLSLIEFPNLKESFLAFVARIQVSF